MFHVVYSDWKGRKLIVREVHALHPSPVCHLLGKFLDLVSFYIEH